MRGMMSSIAYDSATGATIWAGTYKSSRRSGEAPNALAVSPDGAKVYVTGTSVPSSLAF